MWRAALTPVRISISVSLLVRAQGDPVERVFVERIPCPDTKQSAADTVGLGQSYLPRLAEPLNSKLAHALT